MAVNNPPFVLQAAGSKHPAQLVRMALSSLLSAAGIVTAGDYAVSEKVAANMSCNVAAGKCWVPGTSTAAQSQYFVYNDATVNLAIAAANETNARADKIILRIKDEAYAGAANEAVLEIVAGTPEAAVKLEGGGKAPKGVGATPASSIVLAYVLVPAKAVSIVAANIENVVQPFGVRTGAPVLRSGSFTAAAGEVIEATTNGATISTPTPTAGAPLTVWCGGAAGQSVKLSTVANGGKIFGDFLSTAGVTEVVLTFGQHVTIAPDGTNWLIIAGEPKREQTYAAIKAFTKAEAEAGVEPSATRLALVTFNSVPAGLHIGGVSVVPLETTYVVPPGQKWTTTAAVSVSTFLF